jgi:DNA-directed RNA polymerase subunit E'/Rpb7
MFLPIKLYTHVELRPSELDAQWEDRLRDKLRHKLEGLCSNHGFIRPGSLEILRRSAGHLDKAHFNGNVRYYFACRAETCNPATGSVVEARVRNKNQLGVLAESEISVGNGMMPVLEIAVPRRSAGIVSEVDIDAVKIGQTVWVEVLGKRFQQNDRKIFIIGRLVRKPTALTSAVAKDLDAEAVIEGGDAGDAGDAGDPDEADTEPYDDDIDDAIIDGIDGPVDLDDDDPGVLHPMPDEDAEDATPSRNDNVGDDDDEPEVEPDNTDVDEEEEESAYESELEESEGEAVDSD